MSSMQDILGVVCVVLPCGVRLEGVVRTVSKHTTYTTVDICVPYYFEPLRRSL